MLPLLMQSIEMQHMWHVIPFTCAHYTLHTGNTTKSIQLNLNARSLKI